jgi:energy-converting hydrogenase Eha subunit C
VKASSRPTAFLILAGTVVVCLAVADILLSQFVNPQALIMLFSGGFCALVGVCRWLTGWPQLKDTDVEEK